MSAFFKIFCYSFNDQGLLTDFEASLFATSINLLKAFLEFVERENFRMGVRNVYWVFRVGRHEDLGFVLMKKTLFPEVDEFGRHFSLFSKGIVICSFRLSQYSIINSEILLFVGRKYLSYALGVRVNFMVIWSDWLKATFVGLMGLDSLFGQVAIGMQTAADGVNWSDLSGTEEVAWNFRTVLVLNILALLIFALYHADCCCQ